MHWHPHPEYPATDIANCQGCATAYGRLNRPLRWNDLPVVSTEALAAMLPLVIVVTTAFVFPVLAGPSAVAALILPGVGSGCDRLPHQGKAD